MKWTKLGLIFCPDNNFPWMRTHAAGPFAEAISGDRFRIYFGCRDATQRTHIGTVEIDLNRPQDVLDLSREPVVAPGEPGLFDDSGTSMGCLVRDGDARYLYYLGWNLGVTVPWRNTIGVAVSRGGEPFRKHSRAPLLDRSDVDPFSISYPWVMHDEGRWRMWYGSNLSWGAKAETMAHVIKEARGEDPLHWTRAGDVSIAAKSAAEYAISKPCVVKDESGLYRMWYSHRGDKYRIGYAESRDGTRWTRRDEDVGIGVSPSGWDSQSVQYAHVFRHRGRLHMLYNGNDYGKTGIGLAVCESE